MLHEPSTALCEHDIDLAVDRPFDQVWPTLLRCTSRNGFIPVWRAEYDVGGATYAVFARLVGPAVERLALDVLSDLDGIGKYGVPVRALLEGRATTGPFQRPTRAWEATYLVAKQVWKGFWRSPALDRAARLAVEDVDAFEGAAGLVFGRRAAASLARGARSGRLIRSRRESRHLLRSIRVRRGLRDPWLPLSFAGRFLRRGIDPTGLFVAVCGPDGAGKSALASSLIETLGPLFRRATTMHWRPSLLPRLGAVVGRDAPDGLRPHGSRPYGTTASTLRFAYYWADHVLGYWCKVWPLRVRSGFVLLERGYWDMLVDPGRYRMRVPIKVSDAATAFVPTPDVTLILAGTPSLLRDRKDELEVEEIARQVQMWRSLAREIPHAHVIDADRPFVEVVTEAATHVLHAAHSSGNTDLRPVPHSS